MTGSSEELMSFAEKGLIYYSAVEDKYFIGAHMGQGTSELYELASELIEGLRKDGRLVISDRSASSACIGVFRDKERSASFKPYFVRANELALAGR